MFIMTGDSRQPPEREGPSLTVATGVALVTNFCPPAPAGGDCCPSRRGSTSHARESHRALLHRRARVTRLGVQLFGGKAVLPSPRHWGNRPRPRHNRATTAPRPRHDSATTAPTACSPAAAPPGTSARLDLHRNSQGQHAQVPARPREGGPSPAGAGPQPCSSPVMDPPVPPTAETHRARVGSTPMFMPCTDPTLPGFGARAP